MEYNLDFYVEDFKKQIVDTYKAAIRALPDPNKPFSLEKEYGELTKNTLLYKEKADSNYIPALKEDIVFGDDTWSEKERFVNQKKQVYSYLNAVRAQEEVEKAKEELNQRITFLKKPKDKSGTFFNDFADDFVDFAADYTVKNKYGRKIKKYNYRGFGKRTALFVLGIIGLIIGFAFTFYGIIYTAIIWPSLKSDNHPFLYLSTLPIILSGLFFLILGIVFFVLAFGAIKNKKKFHKEKKQYEDGFKIELYKKIKPYVDEANKRYQQLISSLEEGTNQQYIDGYEKALVMLESLENSINRSVMQYTFDDNFERETLEEVYKCMVNGLANSFTSALQYVLEQHRKATERAEDLAIKEQELNMKKAHNEKMEGMAQAQLESQYRSEQAAYRQARAAEESAYYSKQTAASAKQTAKYTEKQAKISQSIKDRLQ